MSLRAMLWAWDDAPVDDAVQALVLLALADEANDDGTDSCPYKAKLIERSRKSERTVQDHLRQLYRKRLINFGDQIVAQRRYGKQPGHAPRAWNLNLAATRTNVPEPRTDEEMKIYARFMATGRVDADDPDGVQKLPPTADQRKPDGGGGQKLPPTNGGPGGVQKLPPTADQRKPDGDGGGGVQPTAPFPRGSKPRVKTSRFCDPLVFAASAPKTVTVENLKEFFSDLGNQEEEARTLADDVEFFPEPSPWEQNLMDECLLLDQGLWTGRTLRSVITTPLMRGLAAWNPDLVLTAFRIAARDLETVSPGRLLWLSRCPHWERAVVEMQARHRGDDAGQQTPVALVADPPPDDASGPPPQQRREELTAMFASAGLMFGDRRQAEAS